MDKVVGVLGGGQLGRMLAEAANRLNIQLIVLDKANSPAKQITAHEDHVDGSFKNAEDIKALAGKCDVVTAEIEHINTEILQELEKAGTIIEPNPQTIATIQDKYAQKLHFGKHGVATAEAISLENDSEEELRRVGKELGYPFMLKSRREAYDGRGNFPVQSEADVPAAAKALGNRGLYAEKWANFRLELAVMVVQTKDSTLAFPTVETVHENSICKLVYAPARNVSRKVRNAAQELAKKAVASFKGKGVYGVEMFLLEDDTLLINEIAPRPHNSGHYTIEACGMSQYDGHLRAITDLPIPPESLELDVPAAIMLNILGGSTAGAHMLLVQKALTIKNARIHQYGKGAGTKGRKMGHITVTAKSIPDAEALIQPLTDAADIVSGKGSASDLAPTPAAQEERPVVAVLMGSDSDLKTLEPGLAILDALKIPYTTRITSAHRTPLHMADYASRAAGLGIKVIIAAAGGAAHLPGMAAAHTPLPVIGIPVKPTIGDGLDSIFSVLNMPRGVPVATVAVNNSVNAALLAARVLGVTDDRIRGEVEEYARRNEEEVLAKDKKLERIGWKAYQGK